ncbi:GAF domain-containing protein [Paenibacillus periandrae]|uniref:GAF domain-containing protein n=1 Tax=Paenibacillus periandrae TaxID=1761741 RepID=UPI001F09790E|nr:GAF domain-containing protein [Paenibacillus periandrae]
MVEYEEDPMRRLIDHLRISSSHDFAALALPREDGRTYAWYYASGNMNHRYKGMVVKRGKGLPGLALRLGEAVISDSSSRNTGGEKLNCALMTAEGLHAAAAVPIGPLAAPNGIIMVGARQARLYTTTELQYLDSCAIEVGRAIQLHNHGVPTEQGGTQQSSAFETGPI